MKATLALALNIFMLLHVHAQKTNSKARVEYCNCHFKIDSSYLTIAPAQLKADSLFHFQVDSSFQTSCGYLLVPENRLRKDSRTIKLPFIILRSKNINKKKDPVFFTGGGPGNSSLQWINGMQRSLLIQDRDCIAFEQRGTTYAIPFLRSFDLDTMIKESYRKNIDKDSMWMIGVKKYRKSLEKRGIDLAGYNSYETVCDIDDLLIQLGIDSVNLMGGSYSGGLMMAVLQKDPNRVRSLVLDSPLPMFSPIDEDEAAHFNEALKYLSIHAEKDSADLERYGHLYEQFQNYFNSIKDRKFHLRYLEKGKTDSVDIEYTKVDLLNVIESNLLNFPNIKDVPFIITEMTRGNHGPYIKKVFDDIFNKNIAPGGMRMLVYCADQSSYHSEAIIKQLYQLYPYMEGYHINDVWKAVCDCWKQPSVNPVIKQAFYSSKPMLVGDGEMDPACSPLYMAQIKHYLPNSQCFLFIKRSHGVGGKDFNEMTQAFIDNPYRKIVSSNKDIIGY
jgi:pimeloyl-ACP methyl ester carboxylesterase